MKKEEVIPLANSGTLANIIESVVFVSGTAIAAKDIADKLEVSEKQVLDAAKKLQEKYDEKSGINLLIFNKKLQFSSNSKYADDVASVLNPIREKALSKTLLESAAIIAYKQPVTRLDLEEIRGVDSEYAIQTLLKLGIIEVVGRKDAIGRPVLFGTTDEFLKRFQISSLDELPDYDSLLAAINVNKKGDYLFEKDVYDESKDPELALVKDAVAGGVVFDDGVNQIEINANSVAGIDYKSTVGGSSSSGNDAGEDGAVGGAMPNDPDEDFDFDDLDEEMPDFLVGEDVEKIE